MVIVKIIGGLGNQMFSYAIGRSIAYRNNDNLLVDDSWIKEKEEKLGVDLYGLNCFEIDKEIHFREKIDHFKKYDSNVISRFLKIIDIFIPYKFKSIIFEHNFKFEPKIFKIKSNKIYIKQGYWQSYKYYLGIEVILRIDFTFKEFVYLETKTIADRIIDDENSVSIHIRRGDYVNSPRVSKIHGGICTNEYYNNAINYILRKIESPVFYIFSDDLKWAKDNFYHINNVVFVETNESKNNNIGHNDYGYRDMYLMTLCRHNIIANSSFSWWGAWLNNNKSKVVIAPKKWFNDSKDTSDLIPSDWVRI